MNATTTGIVAVTLGLVVFFWDARRSVPSRFSWRALLTDLTADSGRAAIAGFVSAAILIMGQTIAKHYWGPHSGDLFFYWYVGVGIAAGVILEFVRRRAKKRAISN